MSSQVLGEHVFVCISVEYLGGELLVRTHSDEAKEREFQKYKNTALYSEGGAG